MVKGTWRGCMLNCSVVSNSVTPWTRAPRLLCPWDSPGRSTGAGSHFLLQGIFPTQGLNPSLVRFLAGRFFTAAPPMCSQAPILFFFFSFFRCYYLFIFIGCVGFSLVVASRSCSLVAVCGLLAAGSSLLWRGL